MTWLGGTESQRLNSTGSRFARPDLLLRAGQSASAAALADTEAAAVVLNEAPEFYEMHKFWKAQAAG